MSIRALRTLLLFVALTGASLWAQQHPVPPGFRYTFTVPRAEIAPGDAPLSLTVRIYMLADDNSPVWTENFTATPDSSGRVTLLIGSTRAGGLPPALFSGNDARWIGVQAGDGPEFPRQAIVSVPYALKARDADHLGGLPASAYLTSPSRATTSSDNTFRTTTTGTTTYTNVAPASINMVPKFIDATELGSSQITDTGLGVGVGTTTPAEMLDIQGRALLRNSSRGPAGMWFGNNDNASAFIGLRDTSASSSLAIFHSGLPRLNITSAGRIGIGVDAPSAALDVSGGIKLSSGVLTFADGTSLSSAPSLTGGGTITLVAGDASINIGKSGSNTTVAVSDAGITTAKLADNAVSTAKIADGSITTAKFSPGALSGAGVVSLLGNSFSGEQSVTVTTPSTPAINAVNLTATAPGNAIYAQTHAVGGSAVSAYNSAVTGFGAAINAVTDSLNGYGIFAQTTSTTGANVGIYGVSHSSQGIGVEGVAPSITGTNYGVYGETGGANYSAGVYGIASNATASSTQYGVYGKAQGAYGIGVLGYASNPATGGGAPMAIAGRVVSTNGIAGYFQNSAATGTVLVAQNATGNVWRVDNAGNEYVNGTVHAGGADFAELVETDRAASSYGPGDVFVIDPDRDRRIVLSSEPYSTRVVGVFATKPGILASRDAMRAQSGSEIPLAMLGIVPVKASAENGAIHRGDLLVTASTPGHVMKATDRSLFPGAIVGKAMQPLESGTGVIEIAVTLQ